MTDTEIPLLSQRNPEELSGTFLNALVMLFLSG